MPAPYHALITPPVGNAPLVFAFLGTGGNETQFAPFIQDILPGAGLVAPRGDVSEGGANRFFRRMGEGVYDMPDLTNRSAAMAAYVEEVRAAYLGRAIYGVGYSNGANILAAMTFGHAGLFDRVALLHPLIPWKPAGSPGLRGMLVLITGGRNDPICPLAMTLALADHYGTEGANVTATLHDGGHEIRHVEVVALAKFFA